MADYALIAEGVTKKFRDGDRELVVLDGLNLSVRAGESVAVLGRSGSGKSTLLHVLGLLDRPDAGGIMVQGMETGLLSERGRNRLRAREIGFVFQSYHLLGEFSVCENVMLGSALGHGGAFGGKNRRKAEEWLERVGLGDRLNFSPLKLSGGERQRVAIARALMAEPSVLLCDEPTGNLDASTGDMVLTWLWQAVSESKAAMVMVTHDKEVAQRADRALSLDNGLLVPGL